MRLQDPDDNESHQKANFNGASWKGNEGGQVGDSTENDDIARKKKTILFPQEPLRLNNRVFYIASKSLDQFSSEELHIYDTDILNMHNDKQVLSSEEIQAVVMEAPVPDLLVSKTDPHNSQT